MSFLRQFACCVACATLAAVIGAGAVLLDRADRPACPCRQPEPPAPEPRLPPIEPANPNRWEWRRQPDATYRLFDHRGSLIGAYRPWTKEFYYYDPRFGQFRVPATEPPRGVALPIGDKVGDAVLPK